MSHNTKQILQAPTISYFVTAIVTNKNLALVDGENQDQRKVQDKWSLFYLFISLSWYSGRFILLDIHFNLQHFYLFDKKKQVVKSKKTQSEGEMALQIANVFA